MGPDEEQVNYRIPARVLKIERRQQRLGGFKNDRGEPEFTYGPFKWWVQFEGSTESLCFGDVKPELEAGDHVDIIIRRK